MTNEIQMLQWQQLACTTTSQGDWQQRNATLLEPCPHLGI